MRSRRSVRDVAYWKGVIDSQLLHYFFSKQALTTIPLSLSLRFRWHRTDHDAAHLHEQSDCNVLFCHKQRLDLCT